MSAHLSVRVAPLRSDDPRRLGDYRLTGRLGQGGMGTVYLAHDRDDLLVAVKVVRSDLAADSEFRARFRSEVHRARQVPPFCTAEVLDADPDHETPYLVVEYVDGPSLAEVVEERGPLSAGNLHALSIGVATALTAIHGAGVVHRDLKPRNVLLAPGSPKVIDFGIARAMEATSQLTRTNQMLGSVAYMAPERFDTDTRMPLGPAADVFAWGAVIAYAGSGRTPFQADSPPATAARILTQPPDLTGLTAPLRDLVAMSLAKDPADRPTARDLLDMLLGSGSQGAVVRAAFAGQPDLRDAARSARAADVNAGRYDGAGSSEITAVPGPATRGRHAAGGFLSRPGARWKAVAAVGVVVALAAGGVPYLFNRFADPYRSAAPGGTAPSASAAAPGTAAGTGAVLIQDDLAKATLWAEENQKEGSCTFRNTIYFVQLLLEGFYLCDGPTKVVANDHSIGVDMIRGRDGACGSIFFLRNGDEYHELQICRNVAQLNRHRFDEVEPIGTFTLDEPVLLGKPTRVSMSIIGSRAEVQVDGRSAGGTPLSPELVRKGGQVTVGVFGEEEGGKPPYEVSFGHIEVRSLT